MAMGCLAVGLTILLLCFRVSTFVTTTLWIDAFRDTANSSSTVANSSVHGVIKDVDPYFVVLTQGILSTCVFGISLLVSILVYGKSTVISDVERLYPKKHFILAGVSQATSAIIINFALSATRSPPYLIALFGNFIVPIQFLTRFAILRARPTNRKLLCTAVVMGAEFLCVLPSIFPSLETKQHHNEDGGATGLSALLWPLSYVMGLIPSTMVNVFMERSVKDIGHRPSSSAFDWSRLNMTFYLFGFSVSFLIVTICLFWVDFIPGYGTSHSDPIFFIDKLRFNFACLLGQGGCGVRVVCLGWATLLASLLFLLLSANILRYTEGANYVAVALTLRSPILFIIWTLVQECPLEWRPHASLSTWLSIVSLAFMLPAVYIYNTGSYEKRPDVRSNCLQEEILSVQSDERTSLMTSQNGSIPIDSCVSWFYESVDGLR